MFYEINLIKYYFLDNIFDEGRLNEGICVFFHRFPRINIFMNFSYSKRFVIYLALLGWNDSQAVSECTSMSATQTFNALLTNMHRIFKEILINFRNSKAIVECSTASNAKFELNNDSEIRCCHRGCVYRIQLFSFRTMLLIGWNK